jgi:riboflavin transporter FmnP
MGIFYVTHPPKEPSKRREIMKTEFGKKKIFTTHALVLCSMLSVIAFILMLFETITGIFPFFLKLEVSDVPAAIGTLAYGPVAGVIIELLKNILKLIVKGTTTGGIGELANFIVGAAFMIGLGLVCTKSKTLTIKRVIVGFVVATISMAVVGAVMNYFIMLPFYTKFMPMDQIIEMSAETIKVIKDKFTLVLYGITPFNIVKGILMSVLSYLLYNVLKRAIKF